MKNIINNSIKVLLVAVVGIFAMVIAQMIIPQPEVVLQAKVKASANPMEALKMVFLLRLVFAGVFSYIILNAKINGLKLFGYLLWIATGISVIMIQSETVIFIQAFPQLSTTDVFLLGLTGLVTNLIFIPAALWVFGKWETKKDEQELSVFSSIQWKRIWAISILYPIIYLFFGYFIAFRFEAVREFYKLSTIQNNQILLVFIQMVRGVLWVVAGLPLFAILKDKVSTLWSIILAYGILPSFLLIVPNPLMPPAVRFGHFLELFVSMTVFGIVIYYVLKRHKKDESIYQ
jgi:hypothetical protein